MISASTPELVTYDTRFDALSPDDFLMCDYGGKPRLAIHEGPGTTEGSVRLTMLTIADEGNPPSVPRCRLAREVSGNDLCMKVNADIVARAV